MALAKGFAGCFVCNVIMLVKIILYIIRPMCDLALAEGDVKRLRNIKISLLYFHNILTL